MLEEISLRETGSDQSVSTNALIDTGSDLTIVSPEWCERFNVKIGPWEGPQLWMANATTASVNGVAEIEVSNSRGKAAGTALVMPMNGYDLLLATIFYGSLEHLRIYEHESNIRRMVIRSRWVRSFLSERWRKK